MKPAAPFLSAFRKLNIVKQVVALYIILIFIPAVLALVLYYQRSSALIEQEYNVSTLKTINQTAHNIAYNLRSVTNASNVFISNPRLYQYLDHNREAAPIDLYDQIQEMRSDIASIENNPDVFKVRIFVDPSLQYAREKIRFFSIEELRDAPWYPRVLEQDGKIFWIGTYEQSYLDEAQPHLVISAARIIRHPSDFNQVIGIVMVDLKEQLIADALTNTNLAEARNFYVADGQGRILVHADRSVIGKRLLDDAALLRIQGDSEGYFKQGGEGGDRYVLYKQIQDTDWRIVAEIPVNLISSQNKTFTKMSGILLTIVTFVAFILLIALLFAFIMKGINRRMNRILRIMEHEGASEPVEWVGEDGGILQKLERNIARTIQNVNRLTEESYRAKLQERELTLRALQAQINPHFLYNTLERIHWMAVRQQASDISAVIGSLSTYFRLTLSKGRDVVTIADEIRLAETYLDIQKTRFEDRFQAVFEIDESARSLKLPKLTLQPIIENALLHGIRKKPDHYGRILIRARHKDGMLVCEVSDDGIGMEPEQVERLLAPPASDKEQGGYGLHNVHERIRLFAGDDCGVTIESKPGLGTTVTIRCRAVASIGDHDDVQA